MPSRLKSLELHGYKTFASRTLFEFADNVTAIVGPNGSGKSNIADSMRWVLGEQSYSLLRGKRTEDMIFSGSEQRPRAGMASATVLFDNNDGWLPIDFGEVAVTRRAYRDGTNEYLVNGQRVRLKDVTELLAQSGLAERTYTIIGQGVVDAALALKAEERRRLFEEAAGIGLYRTRREDALRRLEITRRNLDRVQDILAELQPRLRSLERQARRAGEYEQVRADLQVLLHEWYGYHWHLAQQELGEARDFARVQENQLARARKALGELDEKLAASRAQVQGVRARLNSWHRQLAQLHTRQESLGRQLAVADERRRSLETQQIDLQGEQARLEEELALQSQRLAVAQADAERLQAEVAEARLQVESARRLLAERQAEREEAERVAQAARQELSKLNDRQVQLQARLAERQAQIERLQGSQQAATQAEAAAQAALQADQAAAQVAQTDLEQARQRSQQALQQVQTHREGLDKLSAEQKQLQEQHAAARAEMARLTAQADVLEQAEAELAGYAQGAQLLLKASRESRLQASPSALGSQIEAPAELETAIAAALGEYLDSVILEKTSRLDAALDLLAGQSVRGALLPLDTLAPQPARLGDVLSQPGVLGLASEMVQCPAALRPALDVLLGSTLVVKDRQAARRALTGAASPEAASLRAASLRAVTLAGEVFHASGPVIAGQEGKLSTLSRARQLRELRNRLARMKTDFERLESELAGVAARTVSAQMEYAQAEQALLAARREEEGVEKAHRQSLAALEKAGREVAWQAEQRDRFQKEIESSRAETTRLKQEQVDIDGQIAAAREGLRLRSQSLAELPLDELQDQVNHWNTLAAVAERAAGDARTRQSEREAALQAARSLLASVQVRLEEARQALVDLDEEKTGQRQGEAELSEQIAELRLLIDPAEEELDSSEASQEALQASETSARQALSKAEHNNAQARIALARRQEVLETWRRRIEDDFGLVAFEYAEEISGPTPLPLDGLVEQLPRVDKLAPDVEDNVRRQRAQLRRMGPVNPEAQAEYHEVRDRYRFMTEQVADLEKAETDVRQVIAELDALMQGELRKTFDAVSTEFSTIFKRLFGGGSARLLLTDPDDMTNTGIDIEARLPGRRTQGLSLLSGGERSLTAVSLVFALLRVSPTPFCVLDEVDAMLDEANVGRFREMLRELSQHTQFVIVTHNRNTVQVADAIYGVTMGRDSSSQVISLRLDDVSTIVE